MSYEYEKKEVKRCLECGRELYGRPEKKFCCDDCRMRFHYQTASRKARIRNRILANINRNYEILNGLVEQNVESVDLMEICQMGFIPDCVTGTHKYGGSRSESFCCFDIEYKKSPNRLTNIRRLGNISGKN